MGLSQTGLVCCRRGIGDNRLGTVGSVGTTLF
jgi:hypothetical protein